MVRVLSYQKWAVACKNKHTEKGLNKNHAVTSHLALLLPNVRFVLTYLLTLWCRVLLEKLTGLQLVKKFPAFHGPRRFITALTSVRHLSLSWASPIQTIYPHPTSWRSILILSTHLRLCLPSGLFPSGFPTKTLYTPLSSRIRATCPAHLIVLDFITHTILGEEYKCFSSSLCTLLYSPFTSSFLGPNILLNIMFSNTLSFLSSRKVSDQVSHPSKTTGTIIVLHILIFKSVVFVQNSILYNGANTELQTTQIRKCRDNILCY